MSTHSHSNSAEREPGQGSLGSYTVGFLISLLLTLIAYFATVDHLLAGWVLFTALGLLAIGQLVVQLLFFLHLGQESSPRWNSLIFFLMLIILGIVVGGSLWIMRNLNYTSMSPSQVNSSIIQDEGITK